MASAKKKQDKQSGPAKVKRKPGRPKGSPQSGGHTAFDEIFDDPKNIAKLKKIARNGISNDLIAGALGISRSTFYASLDRRPMLREVIAEARATRISKVASKLYSDAEGGNTTAQIFIMRAQAGWRDKQDLIVNTNVDVNIELETVKRIDQLSPDQRSRRLHELEALDTLDTDIIDVEVD